MLMHPTIDQLRTLKLDGMADAFTELQTQDSAKDLDHAEWLALLLDRETANRNTKRFQSRMRSAKLRHGQASRRSPQFIHFRERLQAAGKSVKTAIIATARKLVVTLNAMLASGTDYRPTAVV